jgi:O-antigen biosynthesis protein
MKEHIEKDYPLQANIEEESLDENNSLKKILRFVGENKRVIDFGCATGYLAKLLHKKGCIVTGVEINPEAAILAREHCEDVIVADLDFTSITEIFPLQKFDVAVFGDVLEHLRNPWKVLEETKHILNKNGFVVASIPNIAHGRVRLALLQGKFEYSDLGILDNTHLRFFTRKTIEDLFEKSGYILTKIDFTKVSFVENNPLIPKVNMQDINNQIIAQLSKDENSEVLQFIVSGLPVTPEVMYKQIKDEYLNLTEKLEQNQAEIKHIRAQLEHNKLELNSSESKLCTTQSELCTTQSELCTTQSELSQTQSELSQTQSELSQTQSELSQTQSELCKKQSELNKIQTELKEYIYNLQQKQIEFEKLQYKVSDTKSELEKTNLDSQKKQKELEKTNLRLKNNQEELINLKSDLEESKLFHENICNQLDLRRSEVLWMKSRKIWKVREALLAFRRLFKSQPSFVFHLDSPKNQEIVANNFQINGWCFSTDLVGIKSLYIRVGEKIFQGSYGLPRIDVAFVYPYFSAAENSGFQIPVSLPIGQYQLQIEAIDSLMKVHHIDTLSITVSTEDAVKSQSSTSLDLNPNSGNGQQGKIKKVKKVLKITKNIAKKILTKQKELGHTLGLQDIPKIISWLKEEYREQKRQINSRVSEINFSPKKPKEAYEAWMEVNQWNEKAADNLKTRLKSCLGSLPKISVVMPVYNPEISFLDLAIASVVNQVYNNWELCIADDCSSKPEVRRALETWAAKDERIHLIFREKNGNISAATNSAASLATGEFIAFLDHDDEITPNALGEVALYIAENPHTDFIYSDDDKIDTQGQRYAPQFKPDWSPELLLSYMYMSHLCVVRRNIFEEVEGIRVGFEGSQDYDFALRATEKARHIAHLPLILYHWRAVPGSTAVSGDSKPASFEAGIKSVQEALQRRGVDGVVFQPEWAIKGKAGIFEHKFPDIGPSVSIIIPTKNRVDLLRRCISSLEKTIYQNYQIIIIDNESDELETLDYLEKLPHKVLKISNPDNTFNFAAINNRAVENVDTDYVLFLNNDTEVISPDWLSQMVGYAKFTNAGAIGARLLYPDRRIQHAGVVHGFHDGLAGHAFKLVPDWNTGYLSYAKVVRNYSAVTAACLLTPRRLFLDLGGFNEKDFAVAYNDVDYCYRLLENNYRCIYCPSAELLHYEGTSRGFKDNPQERVAYRQKYGKKVDNFYSPHLSLNNEHFHIHGRRFLSQKMASQLPPLKVLMCSNALNLTGAPNTQYEVAINLASHGLIKPIVFSPSDGPLRQAYEEKGIQVIIHEHPLAFGCNLTAYNSNLESLQQEIKKHQIDVIYANTLESFFIIDCARKLNIPCVWNIHESEPWENYYLSRYGGEIAKQALECFDYPYHIIFGSHATSELYQKLNSRHNFGVIHSVLDLNRLAQSASKWQRSDARKSLNIKDGEISILLLGTVCERKGQQELIHALSDLPEKSYSSIQCFVVGDRPSEYSSRLHEIVRELPETLKSRIHVIPETQDVSKYYQAADIFVCTSRIECYPRVTLEAMAYGLPIITTPAFGIKEQIQDGINGIFYTQNNPQELKNAILSLLEDSALRERLGKNSKYILEGTITLEEMIRQYGQLFLEAYFTIESMT